ncbi:MAG: hypothetical protein REI12_14770 [Pedobacter sp.]|nr:hypothetical protein [Pedobacter sp.]
MARIPVAVLGAGPLADLLAKRVQARSDLQLAGVVATSATPPAGTHTVIYLPVSTEMAAGTSATHINELLRAGFNVVSTLPAEALNHADVLAACREGKSTFHGSGGFQSSLATRFNRAFSTITRHIREVELVEELDVESNAAHPWCSCADSGIDEKNAEALQTRTAEVGSYYTAGLNLLSEAVFGKVESKAAIHAAAAHVLPNVLQRPRNGVEAPAQIVVQRTLGDKVTYDSVWTKRDGSSTPLRYRFSTTSADAVGHVVITFHAQGDVRPADHLACTGLLDAIISVQESAPGILRHDLDIWQVKTDDRFGR